MIRIDEIYNNTFWPWFEQNRPGTRLFFCDPFGHTDPEHLFNHGRDDIVETDYVFFHDQEPVHLDLHEPLFQEVQNRNTDLWHVKPVITEDQRWWKKSGVLDCPDQFGHVVVSERGHCVEQLEQKYGWTSHYYFYHAWACQDWFRGYDKTFLIARARDRAPSKTFMSPNRIVAGKRDHRVLFLYNVFKKGLAHNHISAPRTCQYEGVDIARVASKYCNTYPDIEQIFAEADLPRLFQGEQVQEMTSCWLSNFAEAADSLVYVPTETVYWGRRTHITEKTFKAIALEMPFVLVAPAGSLEYLREYGFQTFAGIFDESYDEETDDIRRIERVTDLLKQLDSATPREREQIHRACVPRVQHNFEHFYSGGLTEVLWAELQAMLREF